MPNTADTPTPFEDSPPNASAAVAPSDFAASFSQSDTLWSQVLDRLSVGIAILDAQTEATLWLNRPLRAMLAGAVGVIELEGVSPTSYLPNLDKNLWATTLRALGSDKRTTKASPRQRLQFVHQQTRNITYWEWTLEPTEESASSRYLTLTVYSVSEFVMNERMLASEARRADRARSRAEALVRLAQLVNISMTPPEMLRAIAREAAAFFGTPSSAVLLVAPEGSHFQIGYGDGLEEGDEQKPLLLEAASSVAGRAVAQKQTLVYHSAETDGLQIPRLQGGARPATLVTSPIIHAERVYGVVEVYFEQRRDIPEEGRALLAAFADQTALALHKADLYAQIAEQRRQLQSIFDHAPVSILYFDTSLRVVAVNATAARRFGEPVETLTGRLAHEFLTDLPARALENAVKGEPFHASHHVQEGAMHHDGQEVVSDISVLPVRDEQGRVAGILLLSFEITELVKARQEADAARESAEVALNQARTAQTQMVQLEKMRAVGELASGIAHDFNNALMAILGYTELAEDSLDEPEALANYLGIIKKAAQDASSTAQTQHSGCEGQSGSSRDEAFAACILAPYRTFV